MKLKPSEIKLNPDNPRIIKDEKYERLVKSLKDFPEMANVREVVVNKDNVILGGNMRFKAMQEAGWTEIPVKVVDWPEDKQKEFIIKDNASFGEWDWDAIANQYELEDLEAWGVDLPEYLTADETEVEEDEAPEVDDKEPPKSKLGEIYQLGRHRVMCGDSTVKENVKLLMDGVKADMVFTDPPYNALKSWKKDEAKSETRLNPNDWFANDNMSWEEYAVFLDSAFDSLQGHSVYICCDYRIYPIILEALAKTEYELKHCIVWVKNMWGLGKRYRFQHEFIVYATKPKAVFTGDRSQSDVWEIKVDREGDHKTPKPIALCAKGITNSTNKEDVVLDLFLGSGSTLIACEQTDRTCYGMELDPKYVDVIRKRYAKFINNNELPEDWEELTKARG